MCDYMYVLLFIQILSPVEHEMHEVNSVLSTSQQFLHDLFIESRPALPGVSVVDVLSECGGVAVVSFSASVFIALNPISWSTLDIWLGLGHLLGTSALMILDLWLWWLHCKSFLSSGRWGRDNVGAGSGSVLGLLYGHSISCRASHPLFFLRPR